MPIYEPFSCPHCGKVSNILGGIAEFKIDAFILKQGDGSWDVVTHTNPEFLDYAGFYCRECGKDIDLDKPPDTEPY